MTRKGRQMVIKLHSFEDNEEFLANVQRITIVRSYGDGSQIGIAGFGFINVRENVNRIQQMILDYVL